MGPGKAGLLLGALACLVLDAWPHGGGGGPSPSHDSFPRGTPEESAPRRSSRELELDKLMSTINRVGRKLNDEDLAPEKRARLRRQLDELLELRRKLLGAEPGGAANQGSALAAVSHVERGTLPGPMETSLSAGLPPTLPREFLKMSFVIFDPVSNMDPPIANGNIHFDQADLTPSEVFGEEHWARLPPKARIVRDTGKGFESWHFPTGTMIAHAIVLKTSPSTLFELRLMEKLPDGTWAFGIYIPSEDGRALVLQSKGSEALSFMVPFPKRSVRVTMERLHPQSCRTCHFNHGVRANEYYTDEEHAGPCGFVPDNAAIMKEWAPAYQIKHGYWPFEPAPDNVKLDGRVK